MTPDDVFSKEISTPQGIPGHTFNITAMVRPKMFRAECSCGRWEDFTQQYQAQNWCRHHKVAAKAARGAKQSVQ
jgi:hypothetical protein